MFDMENGVFDLTNLNEMADDDVLKANADEVMTEDTNVSVPGGLSEKPKGVPADQNIPTPSKTEITSDQYNAAVGALKKSFKEAVDILGILENVSVIQETAEQKLEREQNDFMENAITEALLQSLENGPIFEAVERSDKNEVKKIVNKVRGKIASKLNDNGVKFYKVNKILSILRNTLLGGITGGPVGAGVGGVATFWNTRMWQIVGMVYLEGHTIKDVTNKLTEELSEELGDYKIVPLKVSTGLLGLFRVKFNWKNSKGAWMLLVDKKLTMEMKRSIQEVDAAVKEATKEAEEKGKPMKESEIEEFSDEIYELTESFTDYAYMEKCSKSDVSDMEAELKDRKKKLADQKKKDGNDCNCKKCKHLQKSIDKLEKKIEKAKEKED